MHSTSIPDDLCLAISNLPQALIISDASNGDGIEHQSTKDKEVLPEIDDDLILEVSYLPSFGHCTGSLAYLKARQKLEAAPIKLRQVQDALVTPIRPTPRREDSL